ncbi:MAG: hypothetical protein NVS9B4_02270 [Candidatus Acidiferrum sp.]
MRSITVHNRRYSFNSLPLRFAYNVAGRIDELSILVELGSDFLLYAFGALHSSAVLEVILGLPFHFSFRLCKP